MGQRNLTAAWIFFQTNKMWKEKEVRILRDKKWKILRFYDAVDTFICIFIEITFFLKVIRKTDKISLVIELLSPNI